MKLQPLVHVDELGASIRFYEALGATLISGSRDGDFALLAIGGAELALLAHPPNPEQGDHPVELCFAAPDLDAVRRELLDAGLRDVPEPTGEGFGRQLLLTTPDGVLVKINELDPAQFGGRRRE